MVIVQRGWVLSGAELARLLVDGAPDTLRNMRARLVTKLKSIETALADDNYDFDDDCAYFIETGVSPREAVIRARAEGDRNWRRRATAALRITQGQVVTLNARIAELGGDARQTRTVTVFRGTVEAVRVQMQAMLDAGGQVYGLASVFDVETEQDVVLAVVAMKAGE